jgi:hypothetical protein
MTAGSMCFVVHIVSISLASVLRSLQISHIRLIYPNTSEHISSSHGFCCLTRNIIDSVVLMFWYSDILVSLHVRLAQCTFSYHPSPPKLKPPDCGHCHTRSLYNIGHQVFSVPFSVL